MIYLIGGPPRSGKSTLAHKLSKKLRCPEISVDWLRSVVLPYLNDEDKTAIQDILFQHGGATAKNSTVDEATVLWPAVKSFVEDKARWRGDFVLDGIHLLPKNVHTITHDKKSNVRVIFLVKTDPVKIQNI
jgi:adenylate kinase family enzyme